MSIKLETMEINGVEYVRVDSIKQQIVVPGGDKSNPFLETGKVYFVRTVTHYFTGELIWVGEKEIVFNNACWIADTGRFSQFMKDKLNVSESEPFPENQPVCIGRGAIVDITEYKPGLILGVK